MTDEARLYEVGTWQGADDYLPDGAMAKIRAHVERMPTDFDLESTQAYNGSIMAKIAFPHVIGVSGQMQSLEDLLQGATLVRTLYRNLAAARAEIERLTAEPDDRLRCGVCGTLIFTDTVAAVDVEVGELCSDCAVASADG